jgi:hypothetical protein
VTANRTRVSFGEIAALGTRGDPFSRVANRFAEKPGVLCRCAQQVKRKPLGRTLSNAWQAPKRLNQALD